MKCCQWTELSPERETRLAECTGSWGRAEPAVTELFWPKGTRKDPDRPLGHSASHTKKLVCQEILYDVPTSVSSRTIARSCKLTCSASSRQSWQQSGSSTLFYHLPQERPHNVFFLEQWLHRQPCHVLKSRGKLPQEVTKVWFFAPPSRHQRIQILIRQGQ